LPVVFDSSFFSSLFLPTASANASNSSSSREEYFLTSILAAVSSGLPPALAGLSFGAADFPSNIIFSNKIRHHPNIFLLCFI
jgi:hypothetical protein